ncbi:MAG TPA: hypothetical protein VHK69_15625 [Chitinophagaceae bacterium]|jgi:hypothetical protein|nr:hypothetical protein [Chitinophagaceae bacterium]
MWYKPSFACKGRSRFFPAVFLRAITLAVLLVVVCVSAARGQSLTLPELVELVDLPDAKFGNLMQRKGFRINNAGFGSGSGLQYLSSEKKTESGLPGRYVSRPGNRSILYTTTFREESLQLREQMKKAGFIVPPGERSADGKPVLYQRLELLTQVSEEMRDTITYYHFLVESRLLPKARSIVFMEDLLQLDAHEYLVALFGPANVKKDVFHLSENETMRCSVLFPNSAGEVVFLWSDPENYRDIMALRVGGDPQTGGSQFYDRPVVQSNWRSKLGVFPGMSLRQLEKGTASGLTLSDLKPSSDGVYSIEPAAPADFRAMGLLLNCLNCSDSRYFTANISSAADITNQKIYISTIILLPQPGLPATAGER